MFFILPSPPCSSNPISSLSLAVAGEWGMADCCLLPQTLGFLSLSIPLKSHPSVPYTTIHVVLIWAIKWLVHRGLKHLPGCTVPPFLTLQSQRYVSVWVLSWDYEWLIVRGLMISSVCSEPPFPYSSKWRNFIPRFLGRIGALMKGRLITSSSIVSCVLFRLKIH